MLLPKQDVVTRGEGSNADIRPGPWVLPANVSKEAADECRQWIESYDRACSFASESYGPRVSQWLQYLFLGLSQRMSLAEVTAKIDVYKFAIAERPAYCFTDSVLRRAMRKFKQFTPSVGEISEFLDEIESETRAMTRRAYECIDVSLGKRGREVLENPTQAPDWVWPNGKASALEYAERYRAQEDAKRRSLAALVRSREGAPAPSPEREPGESDEAFRGRCVQHCRSTLDAATAAMKRGNEKSWKGDPIYRAGDATPEILAAREANLNRAKKEAEERDARLKGEG
jgi:hypothetical protein